MIDAKRTLLTLALTGALSLAALLPAGWAAANGNRLVHLDEPNNPWQFHRESAKLITPQWIGEKGVEAVVVLAIDDMSGDGQHFRNYLTPIIERLKIIDERGPVSITCNRPDPAHPNMQWLLGEGVSLETHTLSHPCPLLQRLDFARASADYQGCVDLLAKIPNNRSVGFRFGCMDGQNTPSPRAYAEILNAVSPGGGFMSMSTSVGLVFTPEDPEVPKALFADDAGGAQRFARYLMTGFVNYLENYPYPFVVGGKIWELPFVYPNDYTGQALLGAQNPVFISDYKAAVDATVAKQGAVSLCFHSGGWMRNDQMVEIVDHADRTHGKKVKFLNMREMHDRMVKHMLVGHPLRNAKGGDNGVRVFDIDGDGYMDVVIGNDKAKLSRIWEPKKGTWREFPFPTLVTPGLHFGILDESGRAAAISTDPRGVNRAWRFDGKAWVADARLVAGLDAVTTFRKGADAGVRLRDIDRDGICELMVGTASQSAVYRRAKGRWQKLPFGLPEGTSIVTAKGGDAGLRFADLDDDGRQDVIFSNAERYGTWMFDSLKTGWSRKGLGGKRQGDGVGEQHPRERNVLAPIVRKDGTNNGAWVKRGHLYWQNEDTGAIMPHHIDQRSFGDLMGDQVNQPRSPGASLRSMQPRPGFRVELVAAEPLVMDPVDVAWGPDGRLWVAEMADYPMGIDNKDKPGSRIAYLTDTDGDGSYDKRTLFADGLETANTVLPWRDGVLVVAPPNIWFLRDTTGDGNADKKEVLYEGFGRGNEQHRANGLVWGLDGWVYVANGDSGGPIRSTRAGKSLDLGGFDLRIRPDTGELEPATGVTQHGRNRDDWGNWVAGNNSNGWQIALEDHEIRRNPKVSQPPARHATTGVIDLYPISRVLSHYSGYNPPPAGSPGKLTSGCGYTFYRDTLFDGEVEPSVYFSCPVHNCVHREVITWNGVLIQTARAADEAQSEFLRSSDSWFRPTAIRTGPDGGMYVADLYRLVIEHPEWIDDTLEREMIADGRLRAGHDRGRIYKVFPGGATLHKPVKLAGLVPAELAAALDSPNGWQRNTAHMMLTWLKKAEQQKAIPALIKVLRSEHPAARTQALSALADLGALSDKAMTVGLHDAHPGVRRNALRVGASFLGSDPKLGERAIALLDDADAHVQRQAAYALGELKDGRAGQALGRFLVKNAGRPYLRAAALTSAGAFPDGVLLAVLAEERTPTTSALANELIGMLGGDARKFVPRVLARITAKPADGKRYEAWKLTAAARLLEAVGADETLRSQVAPMLAAARAILDDQKEPLATRLAAVQLIRRAGSGSADTARLASLLKITAPVELQVAAVKSLLRHDDDAAANRLLAAWPGHGPAVRGAIIDAMLARPKLTSTLLGAMAGNNELAASLDVPRRQLLLRNEDETIRKRAEKLLGGATRPDRAAVIKKYVPALSMAGDRQKGRALFATHCAACHRLDGVGNVIAPDLAALTNRTPQIYLTGILDPNQAIQENWMMYIAKTKDGRTVAGSLVEETSAAVTLVGIDGVRTTIPRGELQSLTSTGRSLMPEGLEASINLAQMADLLAYLQVGGEPRKKFDNNEPKLINQEGGYTVTLPSSAAEVYGPKIVFEQQYRNLGFWGTEKDRAEWTFQLEREGEYDLWVDWALHSDSDDGRIMFTIADRSLSADVPNTGTWDVYRWGRVGSMTLTAGTHRLVARSDGAFNAGSLIDLRTIKLVPKGRGDFPKGVEWSDVETSAVAPSKKPAPPAPPAPSKVSGQKPKPFGGKSHPIPGKIEAEHYDEGPAGVAYHDKDPKNQGADYRKDTQVDIEKRDDASNRHGIGWTVQGEWLNYTVEVAADGNYAIEMPVASAKQGGLFHLEIDGVDISGPIRIPDTGGWTTLKKISHKGVHLKKGGQTIRVVMDEVGPSSNIGDIDYFKFTKVE